MHDHVNQEFDKLYQEFKERPPRPEDTLVINQLKLDKEKLID